MKIFIKKIVTWGIVTIIVLNFLSLGTLALHRNASFYKPSFAANQAQNHFDYIVLGSSMGLTTIDTKLIDDSLGMTGLNLSMDDTGLTSHYLMLQHFLKQDNTVDQVILAISPWDIADDTPTLGDNSYRFLPYVYEDYVKQHFTNLSQNSGDPLMHTYWLPFTGVAYYNVELVYPALYTLINSHQRNRFDDKGNYVYPEGSYTNDEVEKITYEFKANNPFLDKIINLCEQNNIDLLLYQSPIYQGEYRVLPPSLPLINHIDVLKDKTYFYDRIHVNKKGRELVTKELIDQLVLTY